jgi:hypothetical protein
MPLRFILLVMSLAQAAAPAVFFFDGFARPAGRPPTPIVPADYAFTIWGLIYGLSVAYAVQQFVAANRAPPRARWAAAVLFALSSAWLAFARYGPLWLTVPVIAIMLALAAYLVIAVAHRAMPNLAEKWISLALFGLYAGWLTVALFANFTEVAFDLGFSFLGLSMVAWTLLSLAAATALACGIAVAARGNWLYAAAILWAFAAILVANASSPSAGVVGTAIAIAAALVLAASWIGFRAGENPRSPTARRVRVRA